MDDKDRETIPADSDETDSDEAASDDEWPLPKSFPHIVSFDEVLERIDEGAEAEERADDAQPEVGETPDGQ